MTDEILTDLKTYIYKNFQYEFKISY